ncbi:RelA/SpoT domain-containing protein [Pectobacterium versatile]|uniref:RelA/SpoT domain-containing protein n=1 Tax=Pectobacterium versatile TaxID=2488639 RepID=UPI00301A1DF2
MARVKKNRSIDIFMSRYRKEYDFYNNLAKKACEQLENELVSAGVRAIVSHRAKGIDSLKRKIEKRNSDSGSKPYGSADDIYKDIVDLSGVRVALYFPADMDIVESIIEKNFSITNIKEFPRDSTQNKDNESIYSKRFSGYAAKHFRVCLMGNDRYSKDHKIEIQVASVLMHAWSEVEHDLIYKPSQGKLSKEELMILDEINGLVISGNIALERLQSAGAERVAESNYEFKNHYDLSLFITNELAVKDIFNSKGAFQFLQGINKLSRESVKKILDDRNTRIYNSEKDKIDINDEQVATVTILFSAAKVYPTDVINALSNGLVPLGVKVIVGQVLAMAAGSSEDYPALKKAISITNSLYKNFYSFSDSSSIESVSPDVFFEKLELKDESVTIDEVINNIDLFAKIYIESNKTGLNKERFSALYSAAEKIDGSVVYSPRKNITT